MFLTQEELDTLQHLATSNCSITVEPRILRLLLENYHPHLSDRCVDGCPGCEDRAPLPSITWR